MSVKTDRWWMAALPFDWNDLSWLPLLPPAIRIEEYRSDDSYVLRAELPGLDPARDVYVSCRRGLLRLHVHRSPHGDATRSEFHYGSAFRTVVLPVGAREDEVSATYVDGILEITGGAERSLPATAQYLTWAQDGDHLVGLARGDAGPRPSGLPVSIDFKRATVVVLARDGTITRSTAISALEPFEVLTQVVTVGY